MLQACIEKCIRNSVSEILAMKEMCEVELIEMSEEQLIKILSRHFLSPETKIKTKREPTAYNLFVKEMHKRPEILSLPVPERRGVISLKWKEKKAENPQPESPQPQVEKPKLSNKGRKKCPIDGCRKYQERDEDGNNLGYCVGHQE